MVVLVSTNGRQLTRSAKLVRRTDPDLCKIDVQLAGHMVVEQIEQHAPFRPGDFTLVDLSRPCHWAACVRRRRLEQCRRELLAPESRNRQVSVIGARWGLTNPDHFSRAFKAAFGIPPSEYRRLNRSEP